MSGLVAGVSAGAGVFAPSSEGTSETGLEVSRSRRGSPTCFSVSAAALNSARSSTRFASASSSSCNNASHAVDTVFVQSRFLGLEASLGEEVAKEDREVEAFEP